MADVIYKTGVPPTSQWNIYKMEPRCMALVAALYSACIGVLVILFYSWRTSLLRENPHLMPGSYNGIQVSLVSMMIAHLFVISLSAMLVMAIIKESEGLVSLWVISRILLVAFEGVCCVYSNVLRNQTTKDFDFISKLEIGFYVCRAVVDGIAVSGVLKFYKRIRNGETYRSQAEIVLL